MSGDLTAAQRVLSTPELLLEVFLVLDKPGHFGVVNKTFREIARDPVNLVKHFERRYYPFEIMYELLMRPSVYRKVDNLVQTFLARGAVVSRYFVMTLKAQVVHQHAGMREYRLYNSTHSKMALVSAATFQALSSSQSFTDATHYQDFNTLYRLLQEAVPEAQLDLYKQRLVHFLGEAGMPCYAREELFQAYVIVLRGCAAKDLSWHMSIFAQMTGCPSFECPELLYNLLVAFARSGVYTLPEATLTWLWSSFGWRVWYTACRIFRDWRKNDRSNTILNELLRASGVPAARRLLAITTLSCYRSARLTQETERRLYIDLWTAEAKILEPKLFPKEVLHLRPHVNATILWLAMEGFLNLNPNDRYRLLCPTSAILLLSNPFLSQDHFADALCFIASTLPRKHSLESVLEQTVDKLIRLHTSGMQIIELSKRYAWILPRVCANVNAGTVRYVVDEPEFLESYTENPVEIGVRKAMAEQSLNHPEWLEMTPKTGYLPLAIALLSLLDGKADREALDLIYMEAKKRKKEKIVAAYEAAGFGGVLA